jgi:hypothetical protein
MIEFLKSFVYTLPVRVGIFEGRLGKGEEIVERKGMRRKYTLLVWIYNSRMAVVFFLYLVRG